MKKTVSILLAILLGMSIFAGCGKGKEEASKDTTKTEKETEGGEENLLTGKHHVEIQVKDYGTIKVELDADAAPITVTNFVNLAKEGFYDGLTFHRIMSGLEIQEAMAPEDLIRRSKVNFLKTEWKTIFYIRGVRFPWRVLAQTTAQVPSSLSSMRTANIWTEVMRHLDM